MSAGSEASQARWNRSIESARGTPILMVAVALGARLKHQGHEWIGPCPSCGGRDRFSVNPIKRLFFCRGSATGGDVLAMVRYLTGCTFNEAVEEITGDARPNSARETLDGRERLETTKTSGEAIEDAAAAEAASIRRARALWRWHQPIVEDSPAWRYLREARFYAGPIPATLGFLPARGEHPPSVISAFGLPDEPEPGELAIRDDAVRAVHLIRLKPDGSGKAETDCDKVTIGRGALGAPIVIAPPNDLLGLAITEGIEDALSVHGATGLGVWAAGSAGRMPALADSVPAYVDCITVFGHRDGGERYARDLAARLAKRGLSTVLTFLEAERAHEVP